MLLVAFPLVLLIFFFLCLIFVSLINLCLDVFLFESESGSVMSDSLWPHGLYSAWNSLGQNTRAGSLSLPQGFFPTQGSNPGILHCGWILYQPSHYPIWHSLGFLDLGGYFFSHTREVFNCNLLKYFLIPFLFLLFWDPFNSNIAALNVVPEVSEIVLISFHSFFSVLLCFSYLYHSVFQLTYWFFCLSYSTIGSL